VPVGGRIVDLLEDVGARLIGAWFVLGEDVGRGGVHGGRRERGALTSCSRRAVRGGPGIALAWRAVGVVLCVLGPVQLLVDGIDATPRAPRERALLVLLGLRAGQVVPAERLIDELWPDLDPVGARHVLHVRIASIRKALRAVGGPAIEHVGGGYRLDIEPDDVDEVRFWHLVDAASRQMAAHQPDVASATLRAALELWRGDPIADVCSTVMLDVEALRLADSRVGVFEDRIDADLACGRHASILADLDALVAEHPLRERLWAQRVVALYRCGRQADALRACAEVRSILAEQLGLEPGPVLRATEAAVLAHSSDLDWSAETHGTRSVSTGGPGEWRPPVRYARTPDGVNVAYQVAGDGPVDLLIVPGFIGHLDVWWDAWSGRLARTLMTFCRLIVFDKRGTGLSDRPPHSTAEDWVEDARTVLDAAGSRQAVILGMSAGGTVGVLFSVTHPERTRGLVLYGASARYLHSDDNPTGGTLDDLADGLLSLEVGWGTGVFFDALCPSASGDPHLRAEYGRHQRLAASPAAAAAYLRDLFQMDVRDKLAHVRAPALVIHARGDRTDPIDRGRYLARHIPTARLVELDSDDHLIWLTDALDELIDAVRHFVESLSRDNSIVEQGEQALTATPEHPAPRTAGRANQQ
jgi:pimeloyl-ACP methyl ester carboxylesterase/DNA-binding SARP family transcriptional activator